MVKPVFGGCDQVRIIHFYLYSCVFHEFDWSAGYIHFAMKQNMVAVLLLQKMFSCLRDLVFM